jgi:RNA recognition motif-containing protein
MNISHDEAYATAVCLSCENEEPAKPAIPTVEHSSDSADAKAPILGKSLVEPPVRMAETELIRKRTSVKPPARLSETKSIWKRTSLKPLIRTTESDRPVVRKVIADFMTSIEGPPKVKLVPVPGLLNEVKANHQQEIFDGRKESDEDGISSPALIDEQEIEPQKLQEQSETEPMPITQNSAWQEGSPIGEPDNKPTQPSQDETSDLATAELSERARRTIFLGNLPPTATIADLENLFTGLSASVKAYLYTDRSGTLLGTGAVVLSSSTDATAARLARDNAELQGRKIRCMPWFSTSYRRFLQRVITRDAVWLKPGLRSNTEDKPSLEPRAILEPPLPQPSSTQYMLVEEMFRIQDEYQQRRARGVLVTNLDGDVSEADLLELFGAYSASVTAQMRTGPGEERGARSAFVTFANAADATKAKEEVDGTMWGGMEIRVKSIGNREKDEFWGGRGKTLVRDRGV